MRMKNLLSSIISTVALSISIISAQEFDHSHWSESNIERDEFRKPFETLSFFGVEPDDKVVEVLPGGGWYTEILAPYLYDGQVIAAHYSANSDSDYQKRSRANYEQKINSNDIYSNVTITDFVFGEPHIRGYINRSYYYL